MCITITKLWRVIVSPESTRYDVLPGYEGDYPFGMSAAHRKPAYEIGTPSVTWRMAFWKPELKRELTSDETSDELKGNQSESLDDHDRWILQIEYLILHVYDKLAQHRDKWFPEGVGKTETWKTPELSNLQPSQADEPGYLRLLRHKFSKKCPVEGRRKQTEESLDSPWGRHEYNKTRYEAVHIDGVWQSLPLDIRFEVSDEYFTITTTIDFSRMKTFQDMGEPRRCRRPGEFVDGFKAYDKARTALFTTIDGCNKRRTRMRTTDVPESKRQLISDLRESSKFFYFDLWDGSEKDGFDGLDKTVFSDDKDTGVAARLGQRFVDFRNLSLQCEEESGCIVNPWMWGEINGNVSLIPNLQVWKHQSKRDTVIGHSFKTDDLEWVDTIHPILLSTDKDLSNNLASGQVEYTFTKFCHQRCIYGSGFGPQIEGNVNHGEPLTYILLFGFGEHRETGRVVNRLNTLGTLRMGAIHNLQRIKHECDYRLNDIENDLEEIQKLISEAFRDAFAGLGTRKKLKDLWWPKKVKPAKQGLLVTTMKDALQVTETSHDDNEKAWKEFRADHKKPWRNWLGIFWRKLDETWRLITTGHEEPGRWKQFRDKSRKIGKRLTDVHNDLGYLNAAGEKNRYGVKPSLGWIPTRAWRSKYYRDRFDRLSLSLDIKLIEGYQPYDVFLEHRLARAYSIIDLVAHHFAELQDKEIRLRKEWMSLKMNQHQRDIASGQNVVEVFFFLVLLPYYAHYCLVACYDKVKGSSRVFLEDFFTKHHLISHVRVNDGSSLAPNFQWHNVFDDRAALRLCLCVSVLMLVAFRPSTIVLFLGDVLSALITTFRKIVMRSHQFWAWLRNIFRKPVAMQ